MGPPRKWPYGNEPVDVDNSAFWWDHNFPLRDKLTWQFKMRGAYYEESKFDPRTRHLIPLLLGFCIGMLPAIGLKLLYPSYLNFREYNTYNEEEALLRTDKWARKGRKFGMIFAAYFGIGSFFRGGMKDTRG